ncbi:hypothetical protein FB548_3761 [Pseudoxanthomonas sp. 3HH-4]|nr:hypothetical protein FB548_3761 [Pseudoxanthomonas sp. 3HH-4]
MTESMQVEPRATRIDTGHGPDRTVSVRSIESHSGGVRIFLESEQWSAQAIFRSACGYRVLSELDLTEFWSKLSLKDGWLFEVQSGGWLDLELSRPHFTSGRLYELREYLVVGVSDCVSILAQLPPEITDTHSNNSFKPNPLCGSA